MTAAMWDPHDPPLQGLGTMRWRDDAWGEPGRDPAALVSAALDLGVTLFDTAEMYGTEPILGRAMAGRRDELTLCTKFGVYVGESGDFTIDASPENARRAIEGSLRRLGTDVIDVYYLHHRSEDTPIEDTVGAMADLVRDGKVRAIGLSNVTEEDVRRAQQVHPIQAVQEQWSITQRDVESMFSVLRDFGITLVAHSPLGHGSLTEGSAAWKDLEAAHDMTAGQLALAWVYNRARLAGQAVTPLPGITRISNLEANVAAASLVLDASELAALEDSVAGA